nr:hypothetical protein [Methylomarinum sp. Ch1-1]MDP4523049.1 hypothetical protein [Methylomarinum sp. Ch1-1]
MCELNQSKSDSRLTLVDLQSGQPIAAAEMDQAPRFAEEFADARLQSILAPLLKMRALLSLTSLSYQAYRINILNKDGKTTLRLLIEDYELLPARVYLQPIKGYDKTAKRISALLEKSWVLRWLKNR